MGDNHNKMKDVKELFKKLNDADFNYVVLRNWDNLPDNVELGPHSDLDLLTDEPRRLVNLIGAEKTFKEWYRVQHKLTFDDGTFVLIDVRYTGDRYYPLQFEEDILKGKTLHHRGFYIPSKWDYYWALMYHALVHKPYLGADYLIILKGMNSSLEVSFDSLLIKFDNLERPMDKSVFFRTL